MANVDSQRNPLDVLAEEFADRQRRGEHPSMSEYTRRHPELAEEIEQLFPTIVAMEQLKRRRLESGAGRASLGGARLQWLGDYRIIREIGRGGMGIVYEAEQQSLGRRVAIKVLPRQATIESKQLKRFQREAQTAARLHHTNIVPVYGVGQQDGFHYYAMQYIRGLGLDQVLAELRRLESSDDASSAVPARPDSEGMSAAAAALAMLDGRFSVPRKPGSTPGQSDPGDTDLLDGRTPGEETESRRLPWSELEPAVGNDDESEVLSASPPPSAALPAVPPPSAGDRAAVEEAVEEKSDSTALSGSRRRSDFSGRSDSSGRSETPEKPPEEPPAQPEPSSTPSRGVRGRRYWRSVARIGLQVADALQYAHTQGTLHRDIKPANLLLDAQGAVWVTDFGLARALENDRVTRTGDIVGTLRYMAPEQIDGEADARSDIYSLGLTLYELLTLQPAFESTARNQLVKQVLEGSPARPRGICPEIPRDLETIVLKAIAREAEHRYQTAEELCEDLHRFLEDRTILARRPSPAERVWRWCRRNRAVAALTFTAFAAILLAAVLGWVGYVRTARQHRQTEAARDLAERNLEDTLRAFDDISSRITGQAAFQPLEAEAADDVWEEPPPEHVITAEDAALLERIVEFYDQFAERNRGNVKLAVETARANRRVGDIQRRLGDLAVAEDSYRKALNTYADLAEANNAPTAYALERAGIKNDLASVYAKRRQTVQAAQQLRDAERLLLSLSGEQAERPAVLMEQVRTYNQVVMLRGRVPGLSRGDMRAKGERALELLEKLRKRDPENPDYTLATAQTMLRLGGISWFRDREEQAEDPTDKALAMLEQLVADYPDNPTYQVALAEAYAHSTMRRAMFRQPELAVERLRTSIQLLSDVSARYGHIPDYKSSLVRAHMRLAMHLQAANQIERFRPGPEPPADPGRDAEMLENLRTAVQLQSELADDYPRVPGYRVALNWSSIFLAKQLLRQKRFDEARPLVQALMQSIGRSAAARESAEDDAERDEGKQRMTLSFQAEGLELLAQLQRHDGEAEAAKASLDQAATLRQQLGNGREGRGGRGSERWPSGRSRSRFRSPRPDGRGPDGRGPDGRGPDGRDAEDSEPEDRVPDGGGPGRPGPPGAGPPPAEPPRKPATTPDPPPPAA